MAAKSPFWELNKGKGAFWAVLKGRNGRKVATTETYRSKQAAKKAIAVADPEGKFPVKDLTLV